MLAAPPQQESMLKRVKTVMVLGSSLITSLTILSFVIAILSALGGDFVEFLDYHVRVHSVHAASEEYVFRLGSGAGKAAHSEVFFKDLFRGGEFFQNLAYAHVFGYQLLAHLFSPLLFYFFAGAGAAFTVLNMFKTKINAENPDTSANT